METKLNWGVPISSWNLSHAVKELGLLDEVMQHTKIMADTKVGSLRISDLKHEFPNFTKFIDVMLAPYIMEYMNTMYGHAPKGLTWSAWVHTCIHGQGLVPHYHMGDEHLASIIYLTDSKANLVLRSPRANMIRNWPQEILTSVEKDHVVHPRVGEFVVFPTYIDHYVMATEPDFRVSVAIDWCFQ